MRARGVIVDKKYGTNARVFRLNMESKLCVYNGHGGLGEYVYVDKNMQLFDSNVLDLHGFCSQISATLLHFFFAFAYKKRFHKIIIITGPGPTIKHVIEKLLMNFADYVKKMEYKTGCFHVVLRR